METLDFLRFILPSTGTFCAFTLVDKFPRHRFFTSVDNLSQYLLQMSGKGYNTYYAVSSFTGEQRKQDHTALTKAVFLDVDCGADKPYPSWKDGLTALGQFIIAAKLPPPTIVHSGNGLHVYWVLTEELTPDRWRPLAQALKDCCRQHGFDVDPTVVTDSARVLRAPGTVNTKGNKTVRVLLNSQEVTVADMSAALQQYVTAPVTVHTPKRTTTLLDNLAVKQEYPPANATVLASKCQQIGWAVKNQADVPEPFWYALMGVAAFCDKPEEVAIEWSKDHPGYDQTATLKKLAHWQKAATGPATCSKFDSERPDVCKKCRFFGKISTPASLGLQFQEVGVSQDAPDKEAFEVPIPKPYKRTVAGIKYTTDGTDVDVCKFDIYPVGYGYDDSLGYETVRYHWKRPHVGWTELAFRQAYLADHSIREFSTAVADKGIVLAGKKQTESFQTMLRLYMDNLRQIRTTTNLYSTMGWKENNTSFLLGEKLFRADANGAVKMESTSLASHSQRVGEQLYTTAGTMDDWAGFTSLLQKVGMPVHMFVLGLGFAAPLFQFTGLKGLTVNLVGPTGGGKTLAQMWQQSIYGDPTKLHFSAKFTQNAVFARFGLYNNLPVTIDETTMMPEKEVGDFTYWVSQGRDKARLTKTSEEKDAKTWATICTTSANRSMAEKLFASGDDTDAQMARLLEIRVEPHRLFTRSTDAGRLIYQQITTNFGAVGEVYIKHLVGLGEAGIRAMIAEHIVQFKREYSVDFGGQERFSEQAIILADLGNKTAQSLGLIQYDYRQGTEYVLKSIGAARYTATYSKLDCFDILALYMNEHVGDSLTIMHTKGQPKPTYDYTRLPRNSIRVRIDVYRPSPNSNFTHGTLMIDQVHFRKWLVSSNHDTKVIEDLKKAGIDATPPSKKFSMGKDTPIKIGQIYVLGLKLNHDRLQGILNDADDAIDNLTLGQLQVIG